MKQTFKFLIRKSVPGVVLVFLFIISTSWTPIPISGTSRTLISTFAQVDAESEKYFPINTHYFLYEARAKLAELEQLHSNNPTNLAIKFALVKFHTGISQFAGGFLGNALHYAASIFNVNPYIGSLVYEYIFFKNYDFKNSERWYRLSLTFIPTEGMEWREVKFNNQVPYGAYVSGDFSNGKKLPLYFNTSGNYTRTILVPKCVNNCSYKIETNYFRDTKMVNGSYSYLNF